jgi:hypothetical protein
MMRVCFARHNSQVIITHHRRWCCDLFRSWPNQIFRSAQTRRTHDAIQDFHDLMGPIVARGERANEGLALSQQVAAIYELQHFKDYSYASVPILEDLGARWGNEKEAPPLLLKAIDDTLKVLRPHYGR